MPGDPLSVAVVPTNRGVTTLPTTLVFDCEISGGTIRYDTAYSYVWYVDGQPMPNSNARTYPFTVNTVTDIAKKITVCIFTAALGSTPAACSYNAGTMINYTGQTAPPTPPTPPSGGTNWKTYAAGAIVLGFVFYALSGK
jgi:hypothetical protein